MKREFSLSFPSPGTSPTSLPHNQIVDCRSGSVKTTAGAAARAAGMTGQSAPLLLTAGEGPWLWRVVRYGLLAGALDNHKTVFSQAAVSQLRGLGSVISTAEGEWPRAEYSNAAQTFTFADGEDLTLELARFDDAGEITALH